MSTLTQLRIDDELLGSAPGEVVKTVVERIASADPDVFVVDSARVVPLLFEAAEEAVLYDDK